LTKEKEMFSFLKKLFGSKPTESSAEAPYKVEAPTFVAVGEPPATVVVPVEGAGAVEVPAKKPRAKKPAGEKKPRAKKAPKAK
jgi:hypothetical protein